MWNVMKCHVLSWRRSVTGLCRASPAASAGAKAGPHPASPASGGGGFGRLAAGFAAEAERGSVAVMRASFGAKGGTRCPCFAHVSRVRAGGAAGGRIAAARFARLIARARRQAHLARPFPPGSFSRPQPCFCAEKPKGGPGEPPLSTFILHHLGESQAQQGTKNENGGDFSWNAGGAGAGGPARQNWRTKLSSARLRS